MMTITQEIIRIFEALCQEKGDKDQIHSFYSTVVIIGSSYRAKNGQLRMERGKFARWGTDEEEEKITCCLLGKWKQRKSSTDSFLTLVSWWYLLPFLYV